MTMFLMHLFLIGVAPLLLRYAALYLRRVDLRLCWRNTKGAFGALVPKWQVHDDRLPDDLPRRFSFRELKAATGGFSDKNILGKGSFGVVYRVHIFVQIRSLFHLRVELQLDSHHCMHVM